ncbi:MAG TPA: PAS-domain containing protein [Rhizomicrobium sp.]|nr:PAS-domain containing protein [Rhizomicrobium sp.]
MRLDQLRRETGTDKARAEAVTAFHGALLDNAPLAIVVRLGSKQRYFGNGKLLFELLMESPDAPQAMRALETLAREGSVFTFSARIPGGTLALHGAPVGKHAVLYISELARDESGDAQMIDHLPQAMATFDTSRKLTRYNRAYATLWGLPSAWLDTRPSLGDILNRLRERRLIPEQRNFAEWRKNQIEAAPPPGQAIEETWHLPSGKSIRLVTRPHRGDGIFILCEDISEKLKLESSLNLLTKVHKATLDTLDEGVAIFGTDGRVVLHNALFAQMWRLTEMDLAGQPHLGEIANLCASRIGQDGIWGIVAAGVNAPAAEPFREWETVKRADGRIISVALSRLPNGATMASFADTTDLEKFHTLETRASVTPNAFKYDQSA